MSRFESCITEMGQMAFKKVLNEQGQMSKHLWHEINRNYFQLKGSDGKTKSKFVQSLLSTKKTSCFFIELIILEIE